MLSACLFKSLSQFCWKNEKNWHIINLHTQKKQKYVWSWKKCLFISGDSNSIIRGPISNICSFRSQNQFFFLIKQKTNKYVSNRKIRLSSNIEANVILLQTLVTRYFCLHPVEFKLIWEFNDALNILNRKRFIKK